MHPQPTWPGRITLFAAAFVLVGIVLICIAWWSMQGKDRERMRIETEVTAEQMRIRLESWVDDRAAVIAHIGEVHEHGMHSGHEHFHSEVVDFLDRFPDFQAINLIAPDGRVEIVVPEPENPDVLGQSLFDHPEADVRETLAAARDSGLMRRTATVRLLQGGIGFALYRPCLDDHGRVLGVINGVFRIRRLIETCLYEMELRTRFEFELIEADVGAVYSHRLGDRRGDGPITIERQVRIVDRPWLLRVSPSRSMAVGYTNGTYAAVSLAGILLVVLVGLLLRGFLLRQAELNEGRAKYKMLVDNQLETLIKLDARGRCSFVSPSFCRLTGLDEHEARATRFGDLIHPEEHAEWDRVTAQITAPPHNAYAEMRLRTGTGWRWCSWSVHALTDDGGVPQMMVLAGRDVTRRRELEEQLRQSQKMQAVGHLAGGIAHDFNNILQSITGSLELAMLDVPEEQQAHEDLRQALSSADRAAGLTRQLLAFSRRQVLQPRNRDLNDIVEEMRGLLLRAAGEDVPLTFSLSEDVSCLVHADATQLQQVLLNLCVNARDALKSPQAKPGGGIRVRTEVVELDEGFCADHPWSRPGTFAVLEVADEGCGMDPATLELIYEPFFTTKRHQGGTGLGLSTVYGIVSQHDGLMQVDSDPERGTVFRVHLRRVDGEAEARAETAEAGEYRGDETILLAEDDGEVRNFMIRVLEGAGYTVLAAADGEEALRRFHEDPSRVDLALLDVVMPHLGGRELHDALRADSPDLPMLFCSGYDDGSLNTRFIADRDLELISKPYERQELLGRVRALLDRAPELRS